MEEMDKQLRADSEGFARLSSGLSDSVSGPRAIPNSISMDFLDDTNREQATARRPRIPVTIIPNRWCDEPTEQALEIRPTSSASTDDTGQLARP